MADDENEFEDLRIDRLIKKSAEVQCHHDSIKAVKITAVSFGELFYHFIATLSCHSKSK